MCCPAIWLLRLFHFVAADRLLGIGPIGPRHKEEAVLVRIFQSNKASAPTFIDGRPHVSASFDQLLVKLIHVLDTEEKVYAAAAAQHRLEMLGQRDSQFAAA